MTHYTADMHNSVSKNDTQHTSPPRSGGRSVVYLFVILSVTNNIFKWGKA